MSPSNFRDPANLRFAAARRSAANVPDEGEAGNYTIELFFQNFPQFTDEYSGECLIPDGILQTFLHQANDSVLPSRWGSLWRYAAGLYTAHFAAMYLATYSLGSASAAAAAAKAQAAGNVKSAAMGDTSVSYDNNAVTAGTEKWGTWNATRYGQQLVTLARLVGMGGMYVI